MLQKQQFVSKKGDTMPKQNVAVQAKIEPAKVVDKPVSVQELVKNEPVEVAPYVAMDAADDEQVLDMIEGKIDSLKDLVYSFEQDGKRIVGLSWVGTKAAAFQLARKKICILSEEDFKYEVDPTDPEYVLFIVTVKDLVTGAKRYGSKRQWMKLHTRSKGDVPNKFWFEQGKSKATRNAMQDLMPAEWIAKMVDKWMKNGNARILLEDKSKNVPDEKMLKHIAPIMNGINKADTKDRLTKIEGFVIQTTDLNGQEKYYLRQAIANRAKQLK